MKTDYDIIISGGGLAGLTAAIIFAKHDFKTLCIDIQKTEDALNANNDGRTTAISYGSKQLLTLGGLWNGMAKDACPIKDIHIKDSSAPTLLTFLSQEVDGKTFGWIVDNLQLRQHLIRSAQKTKNLDHMDGTAATDFDFHEDYAAITTDKGKRYTSKLLIGADGRDSAVRNALDISCKAWDYGQTAIVFMAYHDKPHNNIAVEHFRADGPFAILPMTDAPDGTHRSSVVWSEHGDSAFMDASDTVFLAAVQERFGDYFGIVTKTSKRFAYPLRYMHADRYIGTRCALIAEAAHAMHPIAGQGLNMSLRDVAAIIELCHDARAIGIDFGSPEILEKYERWRKKDNRMMGIATDALNRLFSNKIPGVKALRNFGLELVRLTKPAKKVFMHQAMGQMGDLPSLIRGEKL